MSYILEFAQSEHVKLFKPVIENILAQEPDMFIMSDDGETVKTHKILISMFSRSLAGILSDHHECGGVPGLSVPMEAEAVRNLVRVLGEGTVFAGEKDELLGVAKCGKLLGIEFKNLQIGGKKKKSVGIRSEVVKLTHVPENNDANLSFNETAIEAGKESKEEVIRKKTSSTAPKNVVIKKEKVQNMYKKSTDICTAGNMVNSMQDLLAMSITILRPEASKHGVSSKSGRKPKLQLVEEVWEHYLKFHLKQTEGDLMGSEVRMNIKEEKAEGEEDDNGNSKREARREDGVENLGDCDNEEQNYEETSEETEKLQGGNDDEEVADGINPLEIALAKKDKENSSDGLDLD
eukprot:GFUD01029694.1.p1 GENE.GFUD01029694.1~~GFUD01029694.1.p1  ORF type:complete len:348 (+),score=114.42 GFUD01029694.1:55-1098(+)